MRSLCGMRRGGGAQALYRTAATVRVLSSAVAPLRRRPLVVGHPVSDRDSGSSGYGANRTSARCLATAAAAPSSSTPVGSPAASAQRTPPTEEVRARSAATAADAAAGDDTDFCSLCDAAFASWDAHCTEHAHVARTVVCRFFVMPERSESIMQHLERHIALDLREVDALALRKVQRRRTRLLAGMIHLVEEGVLRHSIPELVGTPSSTGAVRGVTAAALNVHVDHFMTHVLLGEGVMRREVLDRCARLMPTLLAHELHSVVAYLTTPRQLARVFDEVALLDLLVVRSGASSETGEPGAPEGAAATSQRWTLTRENKSLIVCACLGELHRFHDRTRPRSVTSKAAADAIVLHVLAGHARENLIAELVHDALQRIVDEGTVVWRQYQEETKRRAAALTAQHGEGAGSARNATCGNLRYAPLAAHPTPPRAAAEGVMLDDAASQQLFASYFPFRDVGAPSDNAAVAALAQGDEAAATAAAAGAPSLADPEFMPAGHMSTKHWEPLQAEMRQRAAVWNKFDLVPSSPTFTAVQTKKRDKKLST